MNLQTHTKGNDPAAFAHEGGAETLQLKIGGMSCSFCVASITKALSRMEGVQEASVNLAHEEALVRYEPTKITPSQLKETLLDLGYTVRDADKVRTFEEEEAELSAATVNLKNASCKVYSFNS
jgi:Cu+-exporting ATPase